MKRYLTYIDFNVDFVSVSNEIPINISSLKLFRCYLVNYYDGLCAVTALPFRCKVLPICQRHFNVSQKERCFTYTWLTKNEYQSIMVNLYSCPMLFIVPLLDISHVVKSKEWIDFVKSSFLDCFCFS